MNTLRRRVVGFGALLLIVGIIVGLPLALFAVGANPFQTGIPTWADVTSALTSPDDGTLALGAIKIIAWLAWALLTISLLVEAGARLRGVRAPRMPGLRVPQNAARGLVSGAVMLFVALPVANAAPASAGPAVTQTAHQAPLSATTHAAPEEAAGTAVDTAHRAPKSDAPKTVKHTVQQGESLWSIAQSKLGDGHRFKEIVELNPGVLHGKASFIKAGWELDIPTPKVGKGGDQGAGKADSLAGKRITVEKGDTLSSIAKDTLGAADRYPEIVDASQDIEQPGGAHLTDPDIIDVGWTVQVPGQAVNEEASDAKEHAKATRAAEEEAKAAAAVTDAAEGIADAAQKAAQDSDGEQDTSDAHAVEKPAGHAPAPDTQSTNPAVGTELPAAQQAKERDQAPVVSETTDETADAATDIADSESEWIARTSYGVGAILAAGVLSLVIARRRIQQRRRQPGQRIPTPSPELAQAETELRTTADSLSIETVDIALRDLAHTCTTDGTPLPDVRAARLTATQFDLYLAEPAHLPAPWVGTPDATVWRLDTQNLRTVPEADRATTPAPYPALVTIGHDDEDGHVFLNLEHLGALAITGDDHATREILAALAIELALSTWADDLQVTLVGAFPELEDTLQTGRIRYLPTVGRVVEDLAARADNDRQALAEDGAGNLNTARVSGAVPDAWAPEIVLLAGNITDRQRNQLAGLIDQLPRVALAAVTSGEHITTWGLDLAAAADTATLAPIGLELRPQRLPSEQYGHLLELAALTDIEELDGDPVRDPSLSEVQAVTPVDEPSDTAVSAIPDLHDDVSDGPAAAGVAAVETAAASAEEVGADEVVAPVVEAVASNGGVAVADPQDAQNEDEAGQTAPRIVVLGPVDLQHAGGKVEPSKRARLLEYAAYLALHPGTTHTAIDEAVWPDRRNEDNLNTRNTATSKLRRWVGKTPQGEDYLPRHQAGEGYGFHPDITSDASAWDALLEQDPVNATTEDLEAALQLVRGMPFQGAHRRRYAWAEPIKQRLIAEIVDASYELARRRLMAGRWRAAERAVVVGLSIEPAQENLWRLRILAAHESHNAEAEAEAINRLLTVTEQLECDLEPETEQLLAALKNPGTDFDRLMATAL